MTGASLYFRQSARTTTLRAAAPTQAELQRLLHAIATRTTRALESQGL